MGPVAGKAVRKVSETKAEKRLNRRRKDYSSMTAGSKDYSGFKRPGSYSK